MCGEIQADEVRCGSRGVFCVYGKALGSLMGASGSHEMWWRGQSTCLCLKLRSEHASKPFFLWLAPNRRLQKKGLENQSSKLNAELDP